MNLSLLSGPSEILLLVRTASRKIVNPCFGSQKCCHDAVICSEPESSRLAFVYHRWPLHHHFVVRKETLVNCELVIKRCQLCALLKTNDVCSEFFLDLLVRPPHPLTPSPPTL